MDIFKEIQLEEHLYLSSFNKFFVEFIKHAYSHPRKPPCKEAIFIEIKCCKILLPRRLKVVLLLLYTLQKKYVVIRHYIIA